MTSVLIENVSPEFLPKFRALAKTANAEFKRFVADTKADKAAKAEKAAKTKALKSTKPKKTAKMRGKKAQEPEFYELETMPVRKDIEKWAKANPKLHQQALIEVEREMGLR